MKELDDIIGENKNGSIKINMKLLKEIFTKKYDAIVDYLTKLEKDGINITFRNIEDVMRKTVETRHVINEKFFK